MIYHLLFDLDDTLYSPRYGLEAAVHTRIIDYLAAYLGVSPDEAVHRRNRCIGGYGTTLEWLMSEEGFAAADVDTYLAAIHPPDEAVALQPDPALRSFLCSLDRPAAILTNSPREHADRILQRLGVADCFSVIVDIRENRFQGKPRRSAFFRALDALGAAPETTLFVDDYPRYVDGFRALGGQAVLIDQEDRHPDYPYERIRCIDAVTALLEGRGERRP